MDKDQKIDAFSQILHKEEGWSLDRVDYHAKRQLADFDLEGKRVLDIGCGSGVFSIYFALWGAKRVIGIDPAGAGGEDSALVLLPERIQNLDLINCEFLPLPFTQGMFDAESFDLLFLHNSINHLHEVTSDLREDDSARLVFMNLFAEMYRILAPGGIIVFSDCARSNLFSSLVKIGVRHPLPGVATIEWDKHQEPATWDGLLRENGFMEIERSWYVPAPARKFAKLLNNRLFSYCTFSLFTIRARRPQKG